MPSAISQTSLNTSEARKSFNESSEKMTLTILEIPQRASYEKKKKERKNGASLENGSIGGTAEPMNPTKHEPAAQRYASGKLKVESQKVQ